MKTSTATLFLIAVCFAVVGCGPVYRTQFQYTAPSDPSARACLMQCTMGRQQCQTIAQQQAALRHQNCQLRSQNAYEQCQARGEAYCHREYCPQSASTGHCTTNYNACYGACGGTVQSTQVCVRNCQ